MTRRPSFPRPLADVAGRIMDPVLRRKAGMGSALIAAWPELVGARLADRTRPVKLAWPNRGRGEDEPFRPATLIVAAAPSAALHLQHQTGELIGRLDAFFGFHAVHVIKIVQNDVRKAPVERRPRQRKLLPDEERRVEEMVANVEDPQLREALRAFARATISRSGA